MAVSRRRRVFGNVANRHDVPVQAESGFRWLEELRGAGFEILVARRGEEIRRSETMPLSCHPALRRV